MQAIAHGPEDRVCPFHQKAMAKVCHKCPMWVQIRGLHPQTGEEVDNWNCAIAWGPILAVNAAREMSMMSVEVNKMRNETSKAHDEHMTMAAVAVQRASQATEDVLAKYAGGYAPQLSRNDVPALPMLEAVE